MAEAGRKITNVLDFLFTFELDYKRLEETLYFFILGYMCPIRVNVKRMKVLWLVLDSKVLASI